LQSSTRRWKAEALQYVETGERPADDWNWLAISRHHDFATRLPDWTAKPLAAAYFAVMEPEYGESVIWCFKTTNILNDLNAKTPFEHTGSL
jgi:hypothetical protein